MISPILRILAVLGITAALPLSTEAIELSGSVRTADGDSIAAHITIPRGAPSPGLESHRTGENGRFSIETSGEGILAISASANGYASHEVRGGFTSLRFTLYKLIDVQGRVTDGDGDSLSGAEIRVRYTDSDRRLHLDDGMVAITGNDGAFTVAAAPGQEQFVLDAFAEGRVPQSSRSLGSGSVGSTGVGEGSITSVLIELESQRVSLSGTVTSASGSAISGVPVLIASKPSPNQANDGTGPGAGIIPGGGSAMSGDHPYGSKFTGRVITNSRGRYEAHSIPPGSLAVVAIQHGTVMQPLRFQTSEGDSITADFILPE